LIRVGRFRVGPKWTHALQQGQVGAALAQGALLTNHIAPGKRTLAPSRCGVNASRIDAIALNERRPFATTCRASWFFTDARKG
jgi:hypothetical protein